MTTPPFTFTPDPQLLLLLKSVAKGTLCSDDMGDSCLYCSYRGSFTHLEEADPLHDKECPILLARQGLHAFGLSLSVYCISYERELTQKLMHVGWQPLTYYTVATSEEEAHQDFLTLVAGGTVTLRNILVTLHREILPPQQSEGTTS